MREEKSVTSAREARNKSFTYCRERELNSIFLCTPCGKKITESTSGCDGSYQFLRAAGAPVRRRGAAGAPAARKN